MTKPELATANVKSDKALYRKLNEGDSQDKVKVGEELLY